MGDSRHFDQLEPQFTGALDRDVLLRPDAADRQVWADTFTGLYHVPPDDMPAPRTVLDVGANIGLTAAHYQRLWPHARIVAVEMNATSAALAERNAPSVHVRQHAVTGTGGHGSYDPFADSDAHTFLPGGRAGVPVQALTLRQTILRSFAEGSADFVKLDVEGSEWGILGHIEWAPNVGHLLVELHGDGGPDELVARAIALLERAGFHARRHERHPQAVYAERRRHD